MDDQSDEQQDRTGGIERVRIVGADPAIDQTGEIKREPGRARHVPPRHTPGEPSADPDGLYAASADESGSWFRGELDQGDVEDGADGPDRDALGDDTRLLSDTVVSFPRVLSAATPPAAAPAASVAGSGSADPTGDPWSAGAGNPRWRDQDGEWDDPRSTVLAGDAGEEEKLGALDADRVAKAAAYTFDDKEIEAATTPEVRRAERVARAAGHAPNTTTRPRSDRANAERSRPAAPRPGSAGERATPPRGRDLPTAIGTGIVLGVAFGFALKLPNGSSGAIVLLMAALLLAGFELFTALRQRAFQPAIPIGLAAIAGLGFGTYRNDVDGLGLVLLVTVLASMLWYLFGVTRDRPAVNLAVTWLVVLYIGLLGAFGAALLRLPDGRALFIAPIIGSVAYDVVGYVVGSTIGRRKLAPEVSPNKTWEGLIGGVLGSVIVCGLLFGVKGIKPWNGMEGWVLGLVVGIAAPLGDLCESLLKRDLGIKDTSTLLPGHGGVLDRVDAMLFAVPATYILVRLIGSGLWS